MNDFINVLRKDPQIRIKVYDMLDRYNKLPYNFKLKIGCDILLKNVILREIIFILLYFKNENNKRCIEFFQSNGNI